MIKKKHKIAVQTDEYSSDRWRKWETSKRLFSPKEAKGGNNILHLVQNHTFYKKTAGSESPMDKALNHRPERGVRVELSGSYCSGNKVLLHQERRSAATDTWTMTMNTTATTVHRKLV